jgi:hypothetical protein
MKHYIIAVTSLLLSTFSYGQMVDTAIVNKYYHYVYASEQSIIIPTIGCYEQH